MPPGISPRRAKRSDLHTLENSKAGVKSDTLMTFNLRCVALSVMPAMDRMYPARHSRKTSAIDWG